MTTSTENKIRRTTLVPVMTMEEVPIISDAERADLIASLKEAEAEIAAGGGTIYDSETFRARFIAQYREAKNAKTA